ncbi:MAG: iron-containing alcohol dehydrogenase [Gluconobacter cerinus]|uniref:iron-containing alcohol dehydrogenase n=1 Tax=Gluconobacter cerinus TaxID=38307 RepID=UPI0039E9A9D2
MQFVFQTVPCVHMEWGASKHIAKICSDIFNEKNILIVTDAEIRKAGILQSAIQSLEDNKFNVHIFDGVSADPSETVLLECVDFAKKAEIDCVLGVGGGSSLDVAKLVAVLLKGDQELSGIYGIGNVKGDRTPLVLVPTTAGTGSEVTNISIITTGATTKMGVVAHQLYADIVLLDAQLTIGLPKIHTAATGIDAMVHAIEAYTSRHKKNPLSDALAREALRLLCGSLIKVCRDGEDQSARENMLLGATLAGQAFANSPVGAVHALAYPLGGHYHVPHGISNALMLDADISHESCTSG